MQKYSVHWMLVGCLGILLISFLIYAHSMHAAKVVYLTIDDGPSRSMNRKVDWLVERTIPAIFYCQGVMLEKNFENAVYAIQKGFLIGNHSYSHPHFSRMPIEECIQEIEKAEQLIEQAYKEAGVTRPAKLIRFPYGDRGDGSFGETITKDENSQRKVDQLQRYLKEHNFKRLVFHGAVPREPEELSFADAYWTLDTFDSRGSMQKNVPQLLKRIREVFKASEEKAEVVLIHDFKHTEHLWEPMMETLVALGAEFRLPEV